MMIAYDAEHLRDYMAEAARISPDYPVYLDRFLEGAIESDVDALCDGEEVYIGGILEHIEEAGIHSGDSATCIPPFSFSESLQAKLRETTRRIAMALGVRGLVNVQYAIKGETVYVIEANPRASRLSPRPRVCRWPSARRASWRAIPSRAWACRATSVSWTGSA